MVWGRARGERPTLTGLWRNGLVVISGTEKLPPPGAIRRLRVAGEADEEDRARNDQRDVRIRVDRALAWLYD